MIGWLVDCWWAWRHRSELQELDEQAEVLRIEGERLDRRMAESFGPDWRIMRDNRLAEVMMGRYRGE